MSSTATPVVCALRVAENALVGKRRVVS